MGQEQHGDHVRKRQEGAGRRFPERGTTPAGLIRGFVQATVNPAPEDSDVGSVSFPVSYRNVDRINAEIAHHNPNHIPGNKMLDHILDTYFSIAETLRK